MIDFLLTYGAMIILGIGFIGFIVYLAINHRWETIREIAYKMIRQAENVIVGTKRGQERFNLVLDQLYNIIPTWLKLFITRSYMQQKLQEWFDMIKDSLDDGKINNSTKPPDIK